MRASTRPHTQANARRCSGRSQTCPHDAPKGPVSTVSIR